MNYAIVVNGIVDNVIVGPLPGGMKGICIDGLDVAIGDKYENGGFIKAEPPTPVDPDPLAAYVAGMTDSAYRALPAAMKDLLSKYRVVSPE